MQGHDQKVEEQSHLQSFNKLSHMSATRLCYLLHLRKYSEKNFDASWKGIKRFEKKLNIYEKFCSFELKYVLLSSIVSLLHVVFLKSVEAASQLPLDNQIRF